MRELFDILHRRAGAFGSGAVFDDGTTCLAYGSLARRVAATAGDLQTLAAAVTTIGILGGNSVDWVVGQLAGWQAGKTVVPLPPFFPAPQLRHIIMDAGVSHVLATADMLEAARLLGVPFSLIDDREASSTLPAGPDGSQIIYTSGSTGQPKGVRLTEQQILWTARSLAQVTDARSNDTYLSVLPLALLLETISAIMVPVLIGGSVRFHPKLAARFTQVEGRSLANAVVTHRPSCMVLVPQQLAGWIAALDAAGTRAPIGLRFVAVGGAAVPVPLAQRAWDLGIPVHEGYGLSECGSVVALNRPGARRPGTVGEPLPGLDVRIEEGEIVVHGPSVMDRYLRGASTDGVWRTGDVGAINADGTLTVSGRRDNVIVTPAGRNISPEWIEALLTADTRIAHCVVVHMAGPHLTAILVPTVRGEDWFARASSEEVADMVACCCADVPDYAVPRDVTVVQTGELLRRGLLTGNGRVRRREMVEACADRVRSCGDAPGVAAQRIFG